jgi:hypothetical protein
MPKILKCDFHIHSNFSDGVLSIREIVDLYGRNGFDAIAITDHLCEKQNLIGRFSHSFNLSLSTESFPIYFETLRKEALRAKNEYNMLLMPGYEITKNSFINHRSAHILILGIENYIAPELPVIEILTQAKHFGALTIAAHPFQTNEFEFQTFYLWSRRNKLCKYIDAWEVNSRTKISNDVLNSGLPLIANSDFHTMKHFNSWRTKIYSSFDKQSIFSAIKNQKIDFFLDHYPIKESTQKPEVQVNGFSLLYSNRLAGMS